MHHERLFESRNFALDAEFRSAAGTVVAFFPHRWATRSAMARAYGADFAQKYGLNALLVRSRGPTWFQGTDFHDLAAAIDAAAFRFDRLVLTGASMGGYGAIRVAEHVSAEAVIAFSPISNIDPDIWPYERGFVGDLDPAVGFHRVTRHLAARYAVFYDPLHRDRFHLRAFGLPEDRLHAVAVAGAGHSTSDLLAEAGTLGRITRALIDGQPIGGLLSETRRAKRTCPGYLLALFRLTVARRPDIAARTLTAMIALGHHPERVHRLVRQLPEPHARAVVTEAG